MFLLFVTCSFSLKNRPRLFEPHTEDTFMPNLMQTGRETAEKKFPDKNASQAGSI